MITPEQHDRTMTYPEKITYITDVLEAMDYRVTAYEEPKGISLAGFDTVMNYIELLDLDIFTVDAALKWVTTIWMARAMALQTSMDDVRARIDGMSETDQRTLREGIAKMVAKQQQPAETAEETKGSDTPEAR